MTVSCICTYNVHMHTLYIGICFNIRLILKVLEKAKSLLARFHKDSKKKQVGRESVETHEHQTSFGDEMSRRGLGC